MGKDNENVQKLHICVRLLRRCNVSFEDDLLLLLPPLPLVDLSLAYFTGALHVLERAKTKYQVSYSCKHVVPFVLSKQTERE